MKFKPMFTIAKTRGPKYSHFDILSPDGCNSISILTGGDAVESNTVTVFCTIRGVESVAMFSSGAKRSFQEAVSDVSNTVRCLAVGTLRQREFLLDTVRQFGPNLPVEPEIPAGRAPGTISADQRPLSVTPSLSVTITQPVEAR